MKILLLTQYFPPEFGAAAARNSEHARYWAEAGHEVEVCTGFPNYPSGIVPAAYRGQRYVREACDGYTVHRTWIYATPNRSVLKRGLASLSFMVSALFCGVLRCQRPDVVIASSGPFFVGPLGWLLSVFKRVPLVFEVRDILPQQAVDVGMIRNKLLIRLLYTIEEFLYRRARRVITVADASRRAIAARGFDGAKIFTVENGIREDLFTPGEKDNAVRREYGWAGKFVALYVGAHGVSQGLYSLLEAAELLREEEDIRFVFVGEGADKPGMVAWAEEHGLPNVEFLPLQEKERMPAFYAAADVCFIPLKKGDYFRINIPSKTFEVLACARPIILGAEGQAREIADNAHAALCVPPEDARAYADAVLRLRDDAPLRAALVASGRDYVLENFTRRQKAERYLEILAEMIATGRGES